MTTITTPWIKKTFKAKKMEKCVDAARETLFIMKNARLIEKNEMFPCYHDEQTLCETMKLSFSKWPDAEFAKDVINAFSLGDSRLGMKLAHERVYFYIPDECNWKYLDV